MHDFRVWARDAKRVDLIIDGETLPMNPTKDGWWHRPVERAVPGTRYQLSLDGGPPRPDPRSQYQPLGVDGPSELVDQGSFPWTDSAWKGFTLSGSVLYELHVGTFSPAAPSRGRSRSCPIWSHWASTPSS